MIPFDKNFGPLCELRHDSLMDNRAKNTILKRVQFTSPDNVSERFSYPSHVFSSSSSLSSKCFVFCPICKKNRSKFFCSRCIRNGDFTHSTVNVLERFAEKKLKFHALKGQQNQIESELVQRQDKIIQKERLLLKIRQSENNIALLKRMLKIKAHYLEETNNSLDGLKRRVLKSHEKQINLKKGIAGAKCVVAKQNLTLSSLSKECHIVEADLQTLIRSRVSALTTFIFKIEQTDKPHMTDKETQPQIVPMNSLSTTLIDKNDEDEDTPLLLLSDNSTGSSTNILRCSSISPSPERRVSKETLYYRIGEPWLASNENFANYFIDSPRLESLDHSTDNNFRCAQYRMLSSLSYLCHVTNLIAIFSNLILPKRVIFSDFYGKNIHRDELFSLIAKVCTNIVYLSLFYHVDSENIRPRDMFHNMILLLSNKSSISIMNRRTEISQSFCAQLRTSLLDDLSLAQRDYLAFHDAHDEPEYDFVENNIPDLNFPSPIVDQSSARNIISMISSFCKRATK